jgi:hypothetical protein
MYSKKRIASITDLQKLQFLATQCPDDVGIHSVDGKIIVDAKSFVGLFTLDFSNPVLVVTENQSFHKTIEDIGENISAD